MIICQAKIKTHFQIAGSLWCLIGLWLILRALLFIPFKALCFLYPCLGFIFGYFIFCKMFIKIVQKNISRIKEKEPRCFFAFQSIKSYFIVAIMITLGIIIRRLGVDKKIISFIYASVGISLVKSSFIYFKEIRRYNNGNFTAN